METRIALFQKKEIRKTIHENEWWFVVEDVVLALTDSRDPKQYIQRMKQRDPELGKGWVQIVHTLSVDTAGGSRKTKPLPMKVARWPAMHGANWKENPDARLSAARIISTPPSRTSGCRPPTADPIGRSSRLCRCRTGKDAARFEVAGENGFH